MKAIIKGNEPNSLTEHRSKPHATFENLPKEDVRKALLEEQGHICCYCMRRIPESNVSPNCKIEHYLCQHNNKEKALDYKNMLLACSGQQEFPKHLQTCDTRKGDQVLSYSPCDTERNIETLIKYKPNGEIYSTDKFFNQELTDVLNLNVMSLKEKANNL